MIVCRLRDQQGATAVEMAIVLALLLLLLLGGVDFGLYFYNKHMLGWGTREAARWGVVIAPERRSETDIEDKAKGIFNNQLIPTHAVDEGRIDVVATRVGDDCPVSSSENPCLLVVEAEYRYNPFFATLVGLDPPPMDVVSRMYME
ncbi:TadE/TadG family type IV pilus assembly protein [Candidatus Moduliflexota bacterium]